MGTNEARSELILATIYYFDAPVDAGFVEFFEKTVKPAVIASGATVLAFLVTEHSENTFPRCQCGKAKMFSSGSRALTTRRHMNVTLSL